MNESGIIQTRDLAIGYGENRILSSIDVTLQPGQLTCFMGPNGSGKSTLLRTLCGFQPAISGEIWYGDKNIESLTRKELAHTYSVVLTDRLQSDFMTGRELVATGRMPHTGWLGVLSHEDNDRISIALKDTNTLHLADKWLYQLSDGQRQKLMIARALCQESPVIILDEPTAHLDLNNRVAIVNLLKELAHHQGKSILMATHELDLALQMADRLWLAEPGKSVITGMPEDLVLNGQLDQVFQFKGYDLKTGQVETQRTGRIVGLSGSGSLYLWTKNALERNGYEIGKETEIQISPPDSQEHLIWKLNNNEYQSLELLLKAIDHIFMKQVP